MSIFVKSISDLNALAARASHTLQGALGIEITEVGADYVRGTMPVDERTRQPFGLLHGGASMALAETLGSIAGWLCVSADQACVGIEINGNHVKALRSGQVIGTARPIHLGRSTQVFEVRIEDESGALVCLSRITMAVIPAARPGSP